LGECTFHRRHNGGRDVSKLVKGRGHDQTNLKACAVSGDKDAGSGSTTFEDGYFQDDRSTVTLRAPIKLSPP
jgi:hypothetical protein